MVFVPDSVAREMTEKLAADPAMLAEAMADLDGVLYRETGVRPRVPLTLKRNEDGVYEIWPTELLTGSPDDDGLSDELLELVSAGSPQNCCAQGAGNTCGGGCSSSSGDSATASGPLGLANSTPGTL